MKLHELSTQHRQLEVMVEEEGMTPDMVADTFEALEGEFNDKAVSLISVVNNMNADVEALDAEIKRLQDRKKAITNKQDSLREYLRFNMEASGISKIQCPLFTITLAQGRDMLEINDESQIPDDYVEPVMTLKIDKRKLLADRKEKDIPGCSVVKSKTSLRIK